MAEKKKNSMSMEFALQREMAYRRKIEVEDQLQLRAHIDSGDHQIMAIQVQFPSRNSSRSNLDSSPRPTQHPCFRPKISEVEQVASSSNRPLQQLQLFNSNHHQSLHFFCEVCQVPCCGSLNYKQHINGKKHKVKVQELKFGRVDGGETCAIMVANQTSRCKLCKIWCTDDNLLKQHLAGKKHKKMEQKLECATATVEGDMVVKEQNWCALCGIGCSSKELLHLHFNGKKHQAEKRKLDECAQKGSEGAENRRKRCNLCNTWYANRNSLQMHLREKKHFLNQVEVDAKKRQILQDLNLHSA